MQVSGRAEIVEPFSAEYIHAAEWKKIPVDALKKLPFTMNLIKITPAEIEFLNSDFKEMRKRNWPPGCRAFCRSWMMIV